VVYCTNYDPATSTGVIPDFDAAGNVVINGNTMLKAFARAEGYEDSEEVILEFLTESPFLTSGLGPLLESLEDNTPDNPHTLVFPDVILDLLYDWPKVNSALLDAEKYVILDLSRVTLNDRNTVTGADFVAGEEGAKPPSDGDFNIIWDNQLVRGIVLPASLQTVGAYALNWCYMLESVTIPDGVTSIGEGAFMNCRGLTSVTIGESVTSIGVGAFAYCKALTSVVIPDSVESVGLNAFFTCSSLESVTIGSGVRNIESWAFDFCGALTSVTFRGSGAVIGIDDTFPEGAGLKAAYAAGGAGAYTLSGGVWTKE
jgi:hypothetical protein